MSELRKPGAWAGVAVSAGSRLAAALRRTGRGAAVAAAALAAVWGLPGPAAAGAVTGPDAGLYAVSCISATDCMAVGHYVPAGQPASRTRPLIERWDGARWQQVPAPVPAGPWSDLEGVSCVRASFCVAVGEQNRHAVFAPVTLVMSWNGTRWSIVPAPVPAGSVDSDLMSVSCTASACLAVGGKNFNRSPEPGTLAERWNGSRWTVVTTPAVAATSELLSVSCPAAQACFATGWRGPAGGDAQYLLDERWNGRGWTVLPTPDPAGGRQPITFSVACASTRDCLISGEYFVVRDGDYHSRNLSERWNGSAWTVLSTPDPAGSSQAQLSGVACSAVTMCMAVGNEVNATPAEVSLSEQWNGRTWSVLRTPSPADSASGLTAVACPAATTCEAIGAYTDNAGNLHTLAAQWAAATWRIVPSASP